MENKKVIFVTTSTFYLVGIRNALEAASPTYSEQDLTELMQIFHEGYEYDYLSFRFEVEMENLKKLSPENLEKISRWVENEEITAIMK